MREHYKCLGIKYRRSIATYLLGAMHLLAAVLIGLFGALGALDAEEGHNSIQTDTKRTLGRQGRTAVVAGRASSTASQISATVPEAVSSQPKRQDGLSVGMFQKGQASFYADKFHGRRTASGEIFDMNAMTAAHRTLPFGTVVSVANQANGRTAELRINDRGPYVAGRIIDVSAKAAGILGMKGLGVVPVEMVIVSLPPERSVKTNNPIKKLGAPVQKVKNKKVESKAELSGKGNMPRQRRFAIQIASYQNLKYAQRNRERLETAGIPVHFEKHGEYHRLIIVNLNREQVEYYRAELARLGVRNVLVRQE